LIYPSADTIEQMVGSRYSLVVIAAKRAKQIKEGSPVLIETASTNPLTIALEEIAAGKVTVGEAILVEPPALAQEESSTAASTAPSPIASIISDLTSNAGDVEDDEDDDVAEEAADVA